ncbi:hypothetical protein RJ639_032495 [Escallonia herrerae]|uniref:Cytochrome P450 n=1 Tax=Escallonia herrerae TaxID=1293975 RepID=A0AA88WUP5_9ASTE|nr:hypothetical protein RJ639_032495 [Escallonia herrerae]
MARMPERHVDLAPFTQASPILVKGQLSCFTLCIISRVVLDTLDQFLRLAGIREADEVFAHEFDRFHDHVIDEHLARRVLDKSEKDFIAKDMEDLLLHVVNDPNLEVELNNGVKGFMQDLIAGGTDTSANTVEWPTCELLKHSQILSRREPKSLTGEEDVPCYSLGLNMARSGLAITLHGFNLKLPDNMKIGDLCMEEVYGLATPRKFPL